MIGIWPIKLIISNPSLHPPWQNRKENWKIAAKMVSFLIINKNKSQGKQDKNDTKKIKVTFLSKSCLTNRVTKVTIEIN